MNRPHVLCVSASRETRAEITLSLLDAPVNVVIAQTAAVAIDRLNSEVIHAVIIDARTVSNISRLLETIEQHKDDMPAFIQWDDDSNDGVFTRVDAQSPANVATAITDQLTPTPVPVTDSLVTTVREQLVDVTTTAAVEQTVRDAFVADNRFTFAWLGEYDWGEREIIPWVVNGTTTDWSLSQTFPIGTQRYPLLESVLRDQQLRVSVPLETHDALATVPLGHEALEHGAHSVVVAPLTYESELYGVLAVYPTGPLTEPDREAVTAVATATSHVLARLATRGRLDQLERAVDRYERLVETAGDGMYVLDEDGHFTTVNDALTVMTGYRREGLLGEHVSVLLSDADTNATADISGIVGNTNRNTDTVELLLETKSGRTIPCETQVSLLTHDGEFHGSVGVVRDITERKRSEQRLREQNERLDAFSKIVSHDLRNPLGVAQGYLELVEDTGDRRYLEKAHNGLDRMEAIIDDVLEIARSGEWAAETTVVTLEAVATAAWETVTTASATLEVEDDVTLEVDRSRFLRLLENLFRNSIEHGGPSVTVMVGRLPNGFYVEDDGAGLPNELQETLFDPAVSTSASGLGIGLWVVREVATGHGWSVTATEGETGGARFEFTVEV